MTTSSERLRELLEHAVRAGQPAAALRAMNALRDELDAFERLQVARALDAGGSFGDVARASLVTTSRRCCGPASSSGSSTLTRSR